MAPVPEFYSRATDHVSASPEVFRHLREPTTNLAIWQQNPVTDYSPELQAYLQALHDDGPDLTSKRVLTRITFNNGETLVVPFDRALIRPGYKYLKDYIRGLGNAVIDNAGLPVTFFPGVKSGRGMSSLKYLSGSAIAERIANPKEDDNFHLDGQLKDVPDVALDTPEHPSVAVTVITDFIGNRRTRAAKAAFVEPVAREMVQQLQDIGPNVLTWTNAMKEVARRSGETIYRDLEPGQVGAFAIMPRDMRGRDLFNEEPTRIFGVHRAPILEEGDAPRLTLVLRAQIGGTTPKVTG